MQKPLIPIIDIMQDNQGQEIVDACLNHGFLYIDNREGQVVNIQIVETLQQMSIEFFRRSFQDKNKYTIANSKSLTGYAGFDSMTGSMPHTNETFFIHSDTLFPSNQNAPISNYFEPSFSQYAAACWNLNDKIYKHLSPYLNYNHIQNADNSKVKLWQEVFKEHLWVSRFLHYPANCGEIAPHNDVGLLTILNQDNIGGLQVFIKEQWVDVKPIKNTFVVNIGEILSDWSGGVLKSTSHRVRNTKNLDRYSMTFLPLFDKNIKAYRKEQGEWKYPYTHLAERYYTIFKHLAEKVKDPLTCLQRKTPQEVDDFHQTIVNNIINSKIS